MPKRGLTARQRAFVREYGIDFNATQAAIRAGYSEHTARAVGSENLSKPAIREAVAKFEQKAVAGAIATRAERQEFWTATMKAQNGAVDFQHRLKASELLGKSQADFVDVVEHRIGLEDLLSDEEDE